MTDNKLKNIVAFCALMENGNGIRGKAPSYIIEKFERYCLSDNETFKGGLHPLLRKEVFEEWIKRWHKN